MPVPSYRTDEFFPQQQQKQTQQTNVQQLSLGELLALLLLGIPLNNQTDS